MNREDRDKLRDRLTALDKASEAIYRARKPFDDAIYEIEQVREGLLEDADVSGEFLKCEECGTLIFEGEHYYSYEDGPTFCAEHAPTRAELKEGAKEALLYSDGDEEASEALRSFIRQQEEYEAAGGSLTDKFIYVLV